MTPPQTAVQLLPCEHEPVAPPLAPPAPPLAPPAPPRPRLRHRSSITIGLLASHARERIVATLSASPVEMDVRAQAVAGAWNAGPPVDGEDSFAAHLRTHCTRSHRPPLHRPFSDTRTFPPEIDASPLLVTDGGVARLDLSKLDAALRDPSTVPKTATAAAEAQHEQLAVPLEVGSHPSWESNVSLRFAPLPEPSPCELVRPALTTYGAVIAGAGLPLEPEHWHVRTLALSADLPGWAIAHPYTTRDWTLCVPLYSGPPTAELTAVLVHVPYDQHGGVQPFGLTRGGTLRLLSTEGTKEISLATATPIDPKVTRTLPDPTDTQGVASPPSSCTRTPRPRAIPSDSPPSPALAWHTSSLPEPPAPSRSKSLRSRLGIKRPPPLAPATKLLPLASPLKERVSLDWRSPGGGNGFGLHGLGTPEVKGKLSHSLSTTARALRLPQPQGKTDARRESNASAESSSSPSPSSGAPSPTWSNSSLTDGQRKGPEAEEAHHHTASHVHEYEDPSFHMSLPHPVKDGTVQVTFTAFPSSSCKKLSFRITARGGGEEAIIGHCECGDKVELFPLIWRNLGYPLPRPGAHPTTRIESEGWADPIISAAAVLLGL